MEYDVFISCKSEDYKYAEEIYNFLKGNGFNTFLANKELRQMGDSEYRRSISQALKSTYHLIVFASNADYIDSEWVYYEWDWFLVAKIKGKKQGQLLSILKDVNIDDVNGDLWKYESKTFENYKESLLSYIETPAYLQRKKEAEEKARLAEEKRKQEKEAEQKREKILKEIKEETTDFKRHSSNLDSLALKIIEKKKVVGCIEKQCPVCTTVHPIGETFCSKCGFTFSPIFEENPSTNDTQLFIHQGLWRSVKKAENDKEQFNQKLVELKDKIQKVSAERDNLKNIQSEFQIKIKELSNLLTLKESENKKNVSQAETEKKNLNRRVQILETEVRTKNKELDIVNNKLRISNEEKDRIVQEAELKINELQSQIKLIKEKYKCINAVTNEVQLKKETIDINEEKEVEIEWEKSTIISVENPQPSKANNDNLIPQVIDYATIDNKSLLSLALSKDIEACREIAYRYYSGSKGMTKNLSLANNFLKKADLPLYPTDKELPQSLCFEFKQKKIIMVLSPNKQYYLGNIKAENDDFNWLDEKWIGVGGAAAIAAGAVFMGFVTVPIAIALLLKSIGGFFSDSETENTPTSQDLIVDKEFIIQLSKETNYKFDLPSELELNGIDKSVKNYCFVLRLKDNPNLMQM